MSSFNCFILALFAALMFSGIDVDLAARRLQQLPPLPKTGLPPLPQPTIPTVLKPGSLPSILNLPTLFAALMFSGIDVDLAARRLQQLPPLPKTGLPPLPQPTIPTVLKPGSLPSILNLPSAL
ncbi:hypothetical protein V6N11_071403 [Hibiscus sabdariffa]|uniref:Uncharacterized protein n=1 Tax=Hibiscus sabdariffa TaxID=183260 RepID=A0ABR2U088_9ROSI